MAKLKTGRHTSAIKAHRQSEKARIYNKKIKDKVRRIYKFCLLSISNQELERSTALIRKSVSVLDKARIRGVLHRNKVRRKKSEIMLKFNRAFLSSPASASI